MKRSLLTLLGCIFACMANAETVSEEVLPADRNHLTVSMHQYRFSLSLGYIF